eukprot:12268217-Ditylum_brightwellii.AAC.1
MPTLWDDGFYAFVGDLALGHPPSTIEFDDKWIKPVDTTTCSISNSEKAIAKLSPPPLAVTTEATMLKAIAPICVELMCLVAPLLAQNTSQLRLRQFSELRQLHCSSQRSSHTSEHGSLPCCC